MTATMQDIFEAGEQAHLYDDYVALICPYHDDHHPSLLAYANGFQCASCGAKGNLDQLLDKLRFGFSKPSRENYHNPFSRWLKDMTVGELAESAHRTLQTFPQQAAYLKRRGLESVIGRLGLGFRDGYYIIPILDSKRKVIGLIGRTGEDFQAATGVRYITPHAQEPQIYCPSWKRIQKATTVYFPFGIMDAITLYVLGLPVMTWSTGKKPDPLAMDKIRKRIVIIPDEGEELSANHFMQGLGWRGQIKRLPYPDKTKDTNDIYMHFGAPVLRAMLGV